MLDVKKISAIAFILVSITVSAQNVGINGTGANPDNSSMLDIVSSDKGLLVPRVALLATDNVSPITAPVVSLLVYNTVTASTGATEVVPGYYYWTGFEWTRVNNGGYTSWELLGNVNTDASVNFVGTTDNVNLSFRTNNIIRWVMNTSGQLEPSNTGNSVLIGTDAGNIDDFSSNSNVFIGPNANTLTATNENSIAIGSSAIFDANNAISLGNSSFAGAVNSVAIGFSATNQSIDGVAIGVSAFTDTNNCNTAIGANTNASGGNATAIGCMATATVANTIRLGNPAITHIEGYVDFGMVSDGRFKTDVKKSTLGLDFIKGLEPVTYFLDVDSIFKFNKIPISKLDEQTKNSIKEKELILQYGFIAQDVEKLSDKLGADFSGVDAPENNQDHYALRYAQFVVPLVKAVQEQQEIIEELQKEIELLKSKD